LVRLVEKEARLMNWIEVALVAAAILGIAAGGVLVARSPSFWFGLGSVMLKAAWPFLKAYVTKRMDPETEHRWRQCQLRGGKWNHHKKRCE
jgi:hypothetical protein